MSYDCYYIYRLVVVQRSFEVFILECLERVCPVCIVSPVCRKPLTYDVVPSSFWHKTRPQLQQQH